MKIAGGVPMPAPVRAPTRDGFGFSSVGIREWELKYGWANLIGDPSFDVTDKTGAGLMTLERTVQDAIGETEEAFQRYDAARKKFRSEVKNDVASVEASCKRIAAEFERVVVALNVVQRTLGSAEFCAALSNAERIAAAMAALKNVEDGNVSIRIVAGDE